MPYLVCNKCNIYYELQSGEFADDFYVCTCGNKLKYYKDMESFTNDLKNHSINAKNKNLVNLWVEQSPKIKLISILAVLCFGILLIAGIFGMSSGISDQNAIYGEQVNKPTILLMYAGWWSGCHDFEQKTLSDSKVEEKIGKYYNFQKIDVDQNKDLALKYSDNGAMTLPTIIIVDSNGNEIKRHEGYMTPDEFLEFL